MKNRKWVIIVLASLFTLSATAKKPKKMKKAELLELRETLSHLDERLPVPGFLEHGQRAIDYCSSVVSLSDEQFAADTIAAQNFLGQLEALIRKYELVTPEDMEKYDLNGWHSLLYERAHTVHKRFDKLKDYCNRRRKVALKARAQAMPEGRLQSFTYMEWGSSRPDPVRIAITPDDRGHYYITVAARRHQNDKELKAEATDEQLQTFRRKVEEKKIYQLLPHYAIPYIFEDVPPPTGGGPEWSFEAKFDGGLIATGGADGPIGSCLEIAEWLKQIVIEKTGKAKDFSY